MKWFYRQYRSFSTAQKFVVVALTLLIIFYGAGYGVTNIFKTSQQRAIEACVHELKQFAPTTNLPAAVDECQQSCQQGELANCP